MVRVTLNTMLATIQNKHPLPAQPLPPPLPNTMIPDSSERGGRSPRRSPGRLREV